MLIEEEGSGNREQTRDGSDGGGGGGGGGTGGSGGGSWIYLLDSTKRTFLFTTLDYANVGKVF